MTTTYLIVTTTTAHREDAQRIAREVIDRQLAACVQISGPIESYYRWKGEVECDQEWVCSLKTSARCYDDLELTLRQLHPYDEPQILAVEVERGSKGYLQWLNDQTT